MFVPRFARLLSRVLCCLVILGATAARGDDPQPLALVENGVARVVIVIADQPSSVSIEAAAALQRYLHEMSGALLGIMTEGPYKANYPGGRPAILVGPSGLTRALGIDVEADGAAGDHYVMRSVGQQLALVGNDADNLRGTAFAVYDLLERLGCGWYGPDPLWHVVPRKATLFIEPLEVDERPAYQMRDIWLVGDKWGRVIADAWRMGGSGLDHGHALDVLVPHRPLAEERPELFGNGQPCPTNPDVVEIIVENLRRRIDGQTRAVAPISLSYTDTGAVCECERCQAEGNFSARYLKMVNEVARQLRATHPERFVLTFYAFWVTHAPPGPLVPAEPQVIVMQVNEGDHLRSWDEADPTMAVGQRQRGNGREVANFLAWMQTGARPAIYEWWIPGCRDPRWQVMPWYSGEIALRNLRYWHEHGVRHVSYETQARFERDSGDGFSQRWPLYYLAARGMWNPALTAEQIMAEACGKLYGPAAASMQRFYRVLEDAAANCPEQGFRWHLPSPEKVYPAQVEAAATAALEEAAQLADDPHVQARIAVERRMWDDARAMLALLREGGQPAGAFNVELDGQSRPWFQADMRLEAVRWLHGVPADVTLYVIDPDGTVRPADDPIERFNIEQGARFTRSPTGR